MGKLLPSTTRLLDFSRSTKQNLNLPRRHKPMSEVPKLVSVSGSSDQLKLKMENPNNNIRVPLSEVVSDCVHRWFQDTLKEAKSGDISMQVLVGQMYNSGYGIPRDAQKGRAWITKAAKCRSSVWKVSEKRPGYNASDSDSDEMAEDEK